MTHQPDTDQPAAPAPVGRLHQGEHLQRVAAVVERHRRQVTAMTSAQHDAARHIDAADVALARLLQDIGTIARPAAPGLRP
jgi:hypothetical protein